jgi:hypothetical protein
MKYTILSKTASETLNKAVTSQDRSLPKSNLLRMSSNYYSTASHTRVNSALMSPKRGFKKGTTLFSKSHKNTTITDSNHHMS